MGHDSECICLTCMMADLDATIIANGGQEALDRVNSEMALIGGGKVEAERKRFLAAGQNSGGGKVRSATPKMIKYLKHLLATREISTVKIYPGQYATVETAHCNSWQSAIALIDKLTNAPVKASVPVRMATSGQKRFIASLNEQIIDPGYKITEADINSVTFAEVNDVLDLLKKIIAAEKEENKATKQETVTAGMYKVGNRIFKVQKARQGSHHYAKELKDGSFEYAPGAMRVIKAEHRMTLDEAKAYGKETGQCCQCGRELTVKESIEAGIGPICASKF